MYKYLFILILPIISFSQNLITNTGNRNITNLNGEWHYIVDPYETGYYNYRYEPYDKLKYKNNSAFYNNYHTDNKMALVEYDFDESPTLNVPGDWNSQKEKLFYYEGTIWYKHTFDYNLTKENRLYLYFGAINYKAEIYLNGSKLGTHEGGFTPFNFEVTKTIKQKENYLVVKVDNTRKKEYIPTINTDWWNYGGITRDVKLIEEKITFIEDYKIQLKKENKNIIAGFIKINNPQAKNKVTITIPELNISECIKIDKKGNSKFEIPVKNIKYWSPEKPKLYKIELELNNNILTDQIGFRTIKTVGADILLNDKSIFLRGICIHEENAKKGARAYSKEDAEISLKAAKELGCNYVRLAHYPHNEHIIRLADEIGMLVWEEIPVYWTVDFSNKVSLNNAKNQLAEAITRDKNRASIIIWSMANETPPSVLRNEFLSNLIKHSKSLDDTRLISAALEKKWKEGIHIVDDEIGSQLDIVAFNQYTGWYGGSLEDAPSAKWSIKYNKPVVISEFGGGALQGKHGTIKERWTEEYQEYLYIQNLKMIEKIPNIRGISPWILNDFRSPKRVLPNIQDGWNRKGLISDKGIKKKAFFTVQQFYKKMKKQYN